jgi:hypothetical protein
MNLSANEKTTVQGQVLLRGLGQGVFSEPSPFGSGDGLLLQRPVLLKAVEQRVDGRGQILAVLGGGLPSRHERVDVMEGCLDAVVVLLHRGDDSSGLSGTAFPRQRPQDGVLALGVQAEDEADGTPGASWRGPYTCRARPPWGSLAACITGASIGE